MTRVNPRPKIDRVLARTYEKNTGQSVTFFQPHHCMTGVPSHFFRTWRFVSRLHILRQSL